MNLQQLKIITANFPQTEEMPLLFIGHGSPMNAMSDNQFTQTWRTLGENLPKPKAILSISAHWETDGSRVTAMPTPPTIHDFYHFPQALYQMEYPAPGAPLLAEQIQSMVNSIQLDHIWGLDHGTWSVLCHLYPQADIPVLQLSLNTNLSAMGHFELSQTLQSLRQKGVLIIGSGNIVHNLRRIDFHNEDGGYDWAEEAREIINRQVLARDNIALQEFRDGNEALQLAIPTDEHFLPLLYIMGLQSSKDETLIFNDQTVMGSLAMTGYLMGRLS
ncbi:4,5-DOPA dioxygenase extradiol [Ignatzschineria ureiclastica]|uniref:4,5-DOPA dioxygenase extradiol n=1 Tax=Ignatzschineria ureiclastica TaxID=472582 RepID=A0A2U2AH67_9GAMM|nr:4,5-DOPA dioxygenase extradiol [Ignatzschineria ureiclastica]PWD82004.1 4,5-DOPA dioxygenase extradiol [Ignatzschineria ureiclastica]GGZ91965.1 dioxygenase [Ignatzschineria ureiclastica]